MATGGKERPSAELNADLHASPIASENDFVSLQSQRYQHVSSAKTRTEQVAVSVLAKLEVETTKAYGAVRLKAPHKNVPTAHGSTTSSRSEPGGLCSGCRTLAGLKEGSTAYQEADMSGEGGHTVLDERVLEAVAQAIMELGSEKVAMILEDAVEKSTVKSQIGRGGLRSDPTTGIGSREREAAFWMGLDMLGINYTKPNKR